MVIFQSYVRFPEWTLHAPVNFPWTFQAPLQGVLVYNYTKILAASQLWISPLLHPLPNLERRVEGSIM